MKVSIAHYHGLTRWRVSWREMRKTKRRFFTTKLAAKDFAERTADDLRESGEAWAALPAAARAELADCYKSAQLKGYTIAEACRHFEEGGVKTVGKIKMSDLVSQFLESKRAKNLRPESLRILGITMTQFLKGREDRTAASITSNEITKWLNAQSWGPYRRRGARIDVSNLFNWAVKKQRLLWKNPVEGVESEIIDHGSPKVFTPQQCRDLLKLCRKSFPKLLPWLAVCLFAGLRPAEAQRLAWPDIDLDEGFIRLTALQTKGRRRRLVRIKPALRSWLALRKPGKKLVICKDHQKLSRQLRVKFGTWPRDVLRHSYVSYELAASRDIQGTALEAGHSVDILFRHYREVVTEKQAAEFWALTPEAVLMG